MLVCQIGPHINPSNIHFCANISVINSEWTFKTGPEDQNHCNSWTGENMLSWFSYNGKKYIIIKASEVNLSNIIVLFSSVCSHFVKIKRMQFWNKNPKYALIVSQPYEETRTKRFAAEKKRGTSILSVCNILCEDFPKGTSFSQVNGPRLSYTCLAWLSEHSYASLSVSIQSLCHVRSLRYFCDRPVSSFISVCCWISIKETTKRNRVRF